MSADFTLPKDFEENMKKLLGEEFEAFCASYEGDRFAGLRFNPLKATMEHFLENTDMELTPVPWASEGFYYPLSIRPGKNPLHDAGAYYIQEPSAMSAVSVLDPKPGDFVLDLCAAPGGKSTQIAGRLMGEGLLISNEYVRDRARILSQNIERMGVKNAIVLNENTHKLASGFPSFFDKILVDAPCSGEGMFRKEELAVSEWSLSHVTQCAERQLEILNNAAAMLKPGGTLVYSTCTFNPTENEGTVTAFIKEHPEFSIAKSSCSEFFAKGHPEWVENPVDGLEDTMRLWPHMLKGEGHFVCKMIKEGSLNRSSLKNASLTTSQKKLVKDIAEFLLTELKLTSQTVDSLMSNSVPVCFGENIYLCPATSVSLSGLTVERPGLHVAVQKKNRFEPAHSLALSLKPEELKNVCKLNEADADKYLHGETLNCAPDLKGWVLVSYLGYSLGFGKASNGIIKNHYPKGLRRM